jgi:hypothetical protein
MLLANRQYKANSNDCYLLSGERSFIKWLHEQRVILFYAILLFINTTPVARIFGFIEIFSKPVIKG